MISQINLPERVQEIKSQLIMPLQPKDGFPYYLNLTAEIPLLKLFQEIKTLKLEDHLTEQNAQHRYAPGKWSIKQVIGHITDHERIKMNRAFYLSRKIAIELWGYDQDLLIKNSRFDHLSLSEILMDFKQVRLSSISFIQTLSEKQLALRGQAKDLSVSLFDFLRTIVGHELHHVAIIENRYF